LIGVKFNVTYIENSLHVPFHVAYRVIRIDTALSIFIKTSNNVGHIIGEESLVVECGGNELSYCYS